MCGVQIKNGVSSELGQPFEQGADGSPITCLEVQVWGRFTGERQCDCGLMPREVVERVFGIVGRDQRVSTPTRPEVQPLVLV